MPDKLLEEVCSLLQLLEDFQQDEAISPTKQRFLRSTHTTYVQAKEKLLNDMAEAAMEPYPDTQLYPSLEAYRTDLEKKISLTRSTIRVYFP